MSATATTAKTATMTTAMTTAKLFVFGLLLVFLIAAEADSAQKGDRPDKTKKPPPSFPRVEAVVKQYFEKLPGFNFSLLRRICG